MKKLIHNKYLWAFYLGVVLVLTAFYVIGSLQYNAVFSIVGFSSVAAIFVGAHVNMQDKRIRIPWYFFGLGLFIFTLGDLLAYNYLAIFNVAELPFPSVADVLYLAVYPSFITGMALVIFGDEKLGGTLGKGDRSRWAHVDVLIVLISIGTLLWSTLMVPIAQANELSIFARLVAMLYPLGDLLLLAFLIWLLLQSKTHSIAFYMLAIGLLVLFITDTTYSYLQVNAIYEGTGNWLDAGWMIFYGLFGATALHPSVSYSIGNSRRLGAKRLALFLSIMLIAPLAFVGQADTISINETRMLSNITLGMSCFVLGTFGAVMVWRFKKYGTARLEKYDLILGTLFVILISIYISIEVAVIADIEGINFWREAALSIGTIAVFLWLIRLINDLIDRDGITEERT